MTEETTTSEQLVDGTAISITVETFERTTKTLHIEVSETVSIDDVIALAAALIDRVFGASA